MPRSNTTLREMLKQAGGQIHTIRFCQFRNIFDDELWEGLPHGQNFLYDDPAIQKYLDIEFYPGYGSQNCPNFYAWSKDQVFFIHEYDGSVSIDSAPRNP